jgi:hypothetical protein
MPVGMALQLDNVLALAFARLPIRAKPNCDVTVT